MLSDDELEIIDDWRHDNRIATRSDAIRRLCQMAITLDVDLNTVLDRSEELLKSFEASLQIIEEDMVEVKKNMAAPTTLQEDLGWYELLLFNLRVNFQNDAELFDEYIWVYYHWLEMNNVAQLVAQAGSRRAAIKALNAERDRFSAIRNDLADRRSKFLEDGVDATMPVEAMLPLAKGGRPRRVMLHTKGDPDVSS
jgi:hypothetical protein